MYHGRVLFSGYMCTWFTTTLHMIILLQMRVHFLKIFTYFVMLTPTSKILMWNNKSLCINKILAATYYVSYMVNKTSLSFYIVLKDYNFFYTFLFIHMNMYIAQKKNCYCLWCGIIFFFAILRCPTYIIFLLMRYLTLVNRLA